MRGWGALARWAPFFDDAGAPPSTWAPGGGGPVVPTPGGVGDAGKVITVDALGTGYELDAAGGGGAPYPWRVEVNCILGPPPIDSLANSGAWVTAGVAGQFGGGVLSQSGAGAVGDFIAYDLLLGAGTYTFEAVISTGANGGQAHVEIDDGAGTFTDFGFVEGFGGGGTNVRQSVAGIVIPASVGKRRLKLLLSTKNAGSGGFGFSITSCSFQRTA